MTNHVIHIADNGRLVALGHGGDEDGHREALLLRGLLDDNAELHVQVVVKNSRILLAEEVPRSPNVGNHTLANLLLGDVQTLLLFGEKARNSGVCTVRRISRSHRDVRCDYSAGKPSSGEHFSQ